MFLGGVDCRETSRRGRTELLLVSLARNASECASACYTGRTGLVFAGCTSWSRMRAKVLGEQGGSRPQMGECNGLPARQGVMVRGGRQVRVRSGGSAARQLADVACYDRSCAGQVHRHVLLDPGHGLSRQAVRGLVAVQVRVSRHPIERDCDLTVCEAVKVSPNISSQSCGLPACATVKE